MTVSYGPALGMTKQTLPPYYTGLYPTSSRPDADWQLASGHYFTPDRTLEIVQPQISSSFISPVLPTDNVFYKAYPGIPYDVRVVTVGGSLGEAFSNTHGYYYELTTAPAGMTINQATGAVYWANPIESVTPYDVTVDVWDNAGGHVSRSWTVLVTYAEHKFVDSVNGTSIAGGGDGSFANPWLTRNDVYHGADSGDFIYFRAGTYLIEDIVIGGAETSRWDCDYHASVFLGYPGDTVIWQEDVKIGDPTNSTPTAKHGIDYTHAAAGGAVDTVFFRGINFDVLGGTNRKVLSIGNWMGWWGVYKCTFDGIVPSGVTGDNAAYVFSGGKGFFDNNIVYGGGECYTVLAYDGELNVYRDNVVDYVAHHVFSPKDSCKEQHFYGNDLSQVISGINLQGYGEAPRGWPSGNIFIYFNKLSTATLSNDVFNMNSDSDLEFGDVFVRRNTIVGRCRINLWADGVPGTWTFSDNIIVNNDTGYDDQIYIGGYGVGSVTPNPYILVNNISGVPADGILDANGDLQGAYLTYLGTKGAQIE